MIHLGVGMKSLAASRRVRSALVWSVATLSGAAGLGYEMVWTRLLGVALGTEMLAVLGAIAGLFVGLAVGGWWLDGVVRRAARPGRLYALLEATIAIWGLVCTFLLPAVADWLPPRLGSTPAPGLVWVVSFALPSLLLLPATVAMGGTLAALDRWIRCVSASERIVAGAYAANTLGAVAGTLLTVTWSFGALGLKGTLVALALLNGIAAVAAWWLDRETAPAAEVGRVSMSGNGRLLTSLGITGVLGIAVEVIVVRIASQFLSDTIYTFAALLAAYLLGSAAGAAIRQRFTTPASESTRTVLLVANAAIVLATLCALPMIARWAQTESITDRIGELMIAGLIFLPSALAMGALFADLLEEYGRINGSVGRASAVNALGAALAPALAATVLIPGVGAMSALAVVGTAYVALLPIRRQSFAWAAGPVVMGAFLIFKPLPLPIGLPTGARQVASIEGPMVAASVVDDALGARYLEVNGHFRMGGTRSERSDFRQAWLPLLLHPHPKDVLYIGVGTGATLSGALLYPDLRVTGVEISEETIALLPYFAVPGRPDPTPSIVNADGRRYLAAQTNRYDVVVADNFHPALEGSGSLYAVEHFESVRRRIRAGGLFCQWLPLYQLDEQSLRDIARSFLVVFPDASVWLAHYSVRMPMLALCGTEKGAGISLAGLGDRLGAPSLRERVQRLEFATPMAVAGAYLGGPATLSAYVGNGAVNSDDHPVVALNGHRNVRAMAEPPETLLLSVLRHLRSSPAVLNVDAVTRPRLEAYWRARDRFITAGATLSGEPRGRALIDAASPGLLAAIRESGEFEPAYQPLLAMAQALQNDDPAGARKLLEAIDQAAPQRDEARQLLARMSH